MTCHTPVSRTEPYAGRILDGPHAGDWLESYSHHEILIWKDNFIPVRPFPVRPFYELFPSVIEVHQIYYRWLPSYRAWAWVQLPEGYYKRAD
jgi:hypothetical protein